MNISITGGSGFIGQVLCEKLGFANLTVIGRAVHTQRGVTNITMGEPSEIGIDSFPDGDVFVHLAGYSGVDSKISRPSYLDVNVNWPRRLIEYAVRKNYKHFIFMSSAKVLGNSNESALNADSALNPGDLYAESKCLAEEVLSEYKDDIAITILRPPAVYGWPAVGGFEKIINVCLRGGYLPSCIYQNRRSFICVDNLASAISSSIEEREKGLRTYLVHENEVLSTSEFVNIVAVELKSFPRVIKAPKFIYEIVDYSLEFAINKRLFTAIHESFYIECNKFQNRYGWVPSHNTTEGLRIHLKRSLGLSL